MRWCLSATSLLWAVATACSGVGPTPAEYAAREPVVRPLDDAQRAEAATAAGAALRALRAGDLAEARRQAAAALAIDPRDARAIAVHAHGLMADARRERPPDLPLWQRAEGELMLAARLAPADPEVAVLRAEFLETDGHLSAAADVVERALQQAPGHLGCLRIAGRLRYELAEERAAVPWLETLLQQVPDDAETAFRLAECRLRLARTMLRESGERAEQVAALQRAVASFVAYRELAPGDAAGPSGEAYARLALWRLQGGSAADLEPIAKLYSSAAQLDRISPEPEFHLGVVLELGGDHEAARGAYERALRRDPEHLPSLLDMAASLAADGQEERAASYCRRALRVGPTASERRRLEAFLASLGGVKRP